MKYLCSDTCYDSKAFIRYDSGHVYDLSSDTVDRFKTIDMMKRFKPLDNPARVEPPELDYSEMDTANDTTTKRRGRPRV